jgi:hypothetical protein
MSNLRAFRTRRLVVVALIVASTTICAIVILALKLQREMLTTKRFVSIGVVLLSYEGHHGSLPPAYLRGADGRPAHSWRVLILPLLGYQDLFDRYDFSEPWNGRHNRMLLSEIPVEYQCEAGPAGYTDVVAIVGKDTAWPGAKAASLGNINYSMYILLVQAKEPRNWMEPCDLTYETVMAAAGKPGGLDAFLPQKRNCVRISGQFEPLSPEITEDELQRLLKLGHGAGNRAEIGGHITSTKRFFRELALTLSCRVHFRYCKGYTAWARRPAPAARRCLRGRAQYRFRKSGDTILVIDETKKIRGHNTSY